MKQLINLTIFLTLLLSCSHQSIESTNRVKTFKSPLIIKGYGGHNKSGFNSTKNLYLQDSSNQKLTLIWVIEQNIKTADEIYISVTDYKTKKNPLTLDELKTLKKYFEQWTKTKVQADDESGFSNLVQHWLEHINKLIKQKEKS